MTTDSRAGATAKATDDADRFAGALAGRRIGVFTSVVGFGGSEVIVSDLVEGAVRAGSHVVCWCAADAAIRGILERRGLQQAVELLAWPAEPAPKPAPAGAARRPEKRGWSFRRVWRAVSPGWALRFVGFFADARRFAREARAAAVDMIFVSINGSEAATLGARRARIPVVGRYPLSVTPYPGNLLAKAADWLAKLVSMRSCDLVVHICENARHEWTRRFPVKRSRITVIYNGVVEPTARETDLSTLPIPDPASAESKFIFCVPGRLHPIKGHEFLLRAVAAARGQFRNSLVLCCGDGERRDELVEATKALGIEPVVRFLGFRDDVVGIMKASDCVVLPSIGSENFSIAILEAAMVGIPAIVTDVGGMAEAVLDGETGLVVPPGSPTALQAAMVKMMSDPQRAREMGRAAQERARREFTRDRMIANYLETFASLLSARPS